MDSPSAGRQIMDGCGFMAGGSLTESGISASGDPANGAWFQKSPNVLPNGRKFASLHGGAGGAATSALATFAAVADCWMRRFKFFNYTNEPAQTPYCSACVRFAL
jgi:hypothetical protein